MFFPDYDGVGLLNYCRLIEKVQSECEFWLMPGWRDLLRKYGSNSVWQNTCKEFNAALAHLEQRGMPPEPDQLCQALSLHGWRLSMRRSGSRLEPLIRLVGVGRIEHADSCKFPACERRTRLRCLPGAAVIIFIPQLLSG
jgi:hypothetical protein